MAALNPCRSSVFAVWRWPWQVWVGIVGASAVIQFAVVIYMEVYLPEVRDPSQLSENLADDDITDPGK